MRTFFKRPAWANTKESPSSEFYRRSHQTYGDIVQSNQRLAKVGPETTGKESSSNNQRQQKRRRLSRLDGATVSEDASPPSVPSEDNANAKPRTISISSSKHESSDDQLPDPQESLTTSNTLNIGLSESKGSADDSGQRSSEETNHVAVNTPKQSLTSIFPNSASNGGDENLLPKENDPIVRILITSKIENTQPLYVHRLLSQRLKDVRLAWCERQKFDRKLTSTIILTWKGKRVFDSTTCKSLSISPATTMDRTLWSQGQESETSDIPYDIHLEATTVELLAADRMQTNRASGILSQDSSVPDVPSEDTLIPIVLKNPGQDELRIKVRPGTKVSTIINVFREKRDISGAMAVELSFDGDILGPETQVKDHDIADMDLVDVLIRPR